MTSTHRNAPRLLALLGLLLLLLLEPTPANPQPGKPAASAAAAAAAAYDTHEIELRLGGGGAVTLFQVARMSWPKKRGTPATTTTAAAALLAKEYFKGVRLECDDSNGVFHIITADPAPTVFAPRFSRGWRYPLFLVVSGQRIAKPCGRHTVERSGSRTQPEAASSQSYADCLGKPDAPPAFALADIIASLDDAPQQKDMWSASLLIGVRERLVRADTASPPTPPPRHGRDKIPLDTWRARSLNLPGGDAFLKHCKIMSDADSRVWGLMRTPAAMQRQLHPTLDVAMSNHLSELGVFKRDALDRLERAYGVTSSGGRPASNCAKNASQPRGTHSEYTIGPVEADVKAARSAAINPRQQHAKNAPAWMSGNDSGSESGSTSTTGAASTSTSAASLLQITTDSSAGPGPPTAPLSSSITKYLMTTKAEVMVGNKVVGQVGQAASDNTFQDSGATSTVISANSISTGLPRLLVKHLADNLIAALSETLVDSTEDSLAYLMTEELTMALTPYLSEHLATALNNDVVVRVPEMIDARVPGRITKSLIRTLGPTLTRSLSHAVVPTLVHTLTHSPLQDFYCYYCYTHKAYCQYCQYAPQQLYYAMYYAGFYSSYYTSYYASWSEQKLEQKMEGEFATRRSDQKLVYKGKEDRRP